MADEKLILALGKVIVAAAWIDGEVSHEEQNSLKDLLFRLPQLNAEDWAQLDIYIERPVEASERKRLVAELQDALRSQADKDLVVQALNELVEADGVITDDEKRVVEQIKDTIQEADTGIVGTFSRLIRGPVARRTDAIARAPNREQFFEDFIKNKMYYELQRTMTQQNITLDMPDDMLRKLSLAGGIMAQVAHVDKEVAEDEVETIQNALQTKWHLKREEALLVAQVATSQRTANMDYFRTTREFLPLCTHEELVDFLDVLFEIAAADGMATHTEIEEIRNIARSLLLSHEQFIAAKVKIPKERRET